MPLTLCTSMPPSICVSSTSTLPETDLALDTRPAFAIRTVPLTELALRSPLMPSTLTLPETDPAVTLVPAGALTV